MDELLVASFIKELFAMDEMHEEYKDDELERISSRWLNDELDTPSNESSARFISWRKGSDPARRSGQN